MKPTNTSYRITQRSFCVFLLVLGFSFLIKASPNPAGPQDRDENVVTSHRSDQDVQVAKPQLQFLSWHHRRTNTPDELVEDHYWGPDGQAISDKTLLYLYRVKPWSDDQKCLYLFFSDPSLIGSEFAKVDILDDDGSVIAKILHGHSFIRIGAGRLTFEVRVPSEIILPERVTIRLHYTSGNWNRVAAIPFDLDKAPSVTGVSIVGVGNDVQNHAFVSLYLHPLERARFQYGVLAKNKKGRNVKSYMKYNYGLQNDAQAATFTFGSPLTEIGNFDLGMREKKLVEYKKVSIKPYYPIDSKSRKF